MTNETLDQRASQLIADIAAEQPGARHLLLNDLHDVMGAYSRAGQAVPGTMRRLLEELTAEAVEARFDNMPV